MSVQTNDTQWRWGQDAFVSPEDLGLELPSYFDSPIPDSKSIQSGPIKEKGLKLLEDGNVVSIEGGRYSYNGYENYFWPSEAILIRFPNDSTTYELPFTPDMTKIPSLQSYKYDEFGVIIPNKVYNFLSGTSYQNSTDPRFNITADSNGKYTVTTNELTASSKAITNLSYTGTLSDGSRIFILKEFPITNLNITTLLSDVTIDKLRGVIYTKDNISEIDLTYDIVPLLAYCHAGAISNKFIDPKLKLETEKFTILSPKPDYYR